MTRAASALARLSLLFLVAAVGAALMPGARGAVAAATVKLRPSVGPPGASVKVIGKGFGASEQFGVTFDAAQAGSAATDANGAFSVRSMSRRAPFPARTR